MIRKAVATDESEVRKCAQEAYGPYVAVIGRKPAPMIADFRSQISAGHIYVATGDDGEIEGFIVFFPRDDHMFLENVAVRKAVAGRGIGKSLMRFCEAEARRSGLNSVRLYTNEKMSANLSIYPHLGYVETDRRTEDGFDRVYFEKELA